MKTKHLAEILTKLDNLTLEISQVRAHLIFNTRLLKLLADNVGESESAENEIRKIYPLLSEHYKTTTSKNLKAVEDMLKSF